MFNKQDGATPIRLKLFVPPTFEGVTSVAVIEEILKDDIVLETVFTNTLDFREYEKFKDADMILVLGLAYRGYTLPTDFYINADVPFVDFVHISTYGEVIEGKHIISLVDEHTDPIKVLYNIMKNMASSLNLSKHVELTDQAMYMVEAVNAYRTWTWEGNNTTRMLLALYHASYKRLPKLLHGLSLQEVVKAHAPVIKGQLEKLEDYIERKSQMVQSRQVVIDGQECILKLVYAEEYINELANDILHQEDTTVPVIVCVGRTTKSNDIFSVRTKGIHAGRVAEVINGGGGKENVATFFAPVGCATLMANATVTNIHNGSL
ncbi:phosphodiesterase [Bacillus phage Hobo]|uniref:Uncharacterized protein n=2 Tax=Caeruleovirus BM15 TaxID=1985178 RepID=A0A0S2MUK5_9CAUD|nr:exopolyphosphatase [Bacillus phage BM15]ALO79562.1 hypothetical protein BM10_158 [Bacillus phage BM15]AXQ66913.1 phosphodiesterase [Bacillus phage Hobo]